MSSLGKHIAYDVLPGFTVWKKLARATGTWLWFSDDRRLGRHRVRLERTRVGVAVSVNLDLVRGKGHHVQALG